MARLFIVAGMPRTGTTFLYHNFSLHPDVVVPVRKELNLFLRRRSISPVEVAKWFPGSSGQSLLADISPLYFYDLRTIERIQEFDPDTRVIIGVRDPVSFVISQYGQFSSYDAHPPDFREHLKRHAIVVGPVRVDFSLEDGVIRKHLAGFIRAFGDRLLLFDFDALQREPLSVLRSIEQFLEIRPHFEHAQLDRRVYNSLGRDANRWLIRMAPMLPVIDALTRWLPFRVTYSLRKTFDVMSAALGRDRRVQSIASPELEAELRQLLRDDCEFISRVLAGKPTRRGNEVQAVCNSLLDAKSLSDRLDAGNETASSGATE